MLEPLEERTLLSIQTFATGNISLAIPDKPTTGLNPIWSTLNVPVAGTVRDVNVTLNINHTWDADLDVFLIGPDGTRVELFTDVGGSGNNFTGTILDDEVTGVIGSSGLNSAPFNRAEGYRPEGSLSAFDGKSLQGAWQLEITDDTGGDVGTLVSWSLTIDYSSRFTVGPETLVNSHTSGEQTTFLENKQSVAADAVGNSVVVWTSTGQDEGSTRGVYAQRFDAAGNRLGGELQVNTVTANDQSTPSVAMAPGGAFVVVWRSVGQETGGASNSNGVFARLYNAAGEPQGPEFQVNTTIANAQTLPSVAMAAAGNFIIAWQSYGQDGSDYGIFARRYNAAGVAQGPELAVNTFTAGAQSNPVIAADAAGNFVIAWQSDSQDGSGLNIYARRFDAAGVPRDPNEFRVNTFASKDQESPSVAMDQDGDFVVAWESFGQESSGSAAVYARRYNAAGVAQDTAEVRVNTHTPNQQRRASVAMDPAGNFLVTWSSLGQDVTSTWGVYGQYFSPSGARLGSEFPINTTTAGNQESSSVALAGDGQHLVVIWSGRGPDDNSGDGVFAQWYFDGDVANDFALAQPLRVLSDGSSSQIGTIEVAGDQDLYRFTATVTGLIRVEQRKTTGSNLDSFLYAYDAAGNKLAQDDDSGGDRNSRLTLPVVAGQTYYLRAAGYGNSTGGYDLRITPMPDLVGELLEVGESAAQWGTTVTLHYTIRNQGSANAGPSVVVPFLSSDATIYWDNDVLMREGVVQIPGLAPGRSVTNALKVKLPDAPPPGFPASGLVYLGLILDYNNDVIEISGTNNRNQGDGKDRVQLTILQDNEVEANNNPADANSIRPNATINGRIGPAGDVDVYKFEVSTGGYLDVTITRPPGSALDSRLVLANVDSFLTFDNLPIAGGGLLLSSDDQAPGNLDPYLRQYLLPGTYYVAVSSAARDAAAMGDYRLDVRFSPNANNPFAASTNLRNLAVGADPRGLVVGDFNRDDILDLATVNRGSRDVSVLLGIGDGTFAPQRRYSIPDQPQEIIVIDFNNDGRPDLATLDRTTGFVSLLPGVGDGTFLPQKVQRLSLNDPRLAALVNGAEMFNRSTPIPDNGQVLSRLFIGENITINDLDVFVDLTHPSDKDLDVFLVGPDGTRVELFTDLNLGFRVSPGRTVSFDSLNPILDDEATTAITAASKPVRGRFRPEQLLRAFDGKSLRGTWTLEVRDDNDNGKTGTLVNWALFVNGGKFYTNFSGTTANFDFNRDGTLDKAELIANTNGQLSYESYVALDVALPVNSKATADLAKANVILTVEDWIPDGDVSPQKVPVDVFFGGDIFLSTNYTPANPTLAVPLVGHLNGDQTPDMVLVRANGDILLRHGKPGSPGEFDPFLILNQDRGQNPGARALAIVKEGANAVLAAIDLFSNSLSLYYRQANGSWLRQTGPVTGLQPVAIAAGDLDGDGYKDLVVANAQFGSLSFFLGQTNGSFRPLAQQVKVGFTLADVVLKDVNGDQALDVLLTDPASGTVAVLLNRKLPMGDVGFFEERRFRAGTGTYGVVEGPSSTANETIQAIYGVDVAFPPQYLTYSKDQTNTVVTGDFNRDGVLDLVVTNRGSNTFAVLLGKKQNNGALGSFVDPRVFRTAAAPTAVRAGQFNDDNRDGYINSNDFLDLVILNEDSATISVFLGNGQGGFLPENLQNRLSVGKNPTGMTLVDITRPGGGRPDSIPDLLVSNLFGDLLVLAGNGLGSFRPGLREVPLAVTDLNGDGLADVVVANQKMDRVYVRFRKPGTKEFTDPVFQNKNQALLAPGAVQLVQLDRDGIPDLVVASTLANQVLVYRGLGNGQFRAPVSYAAGTQPVAVTAKDLTGDGVLDLVVANKGSNDVSVLLGAINPTSRTWSATSGPRLNSGGQGPLGVDVRDQNGDGIPDLVVTNSNGHITALPGIGANGRGTGFFRDLNPLSAVLPPLTQQPSPVGVTVPGHVIFVDPGTFNFRTIFTGRAVEAVDIVGSILVAVFRDGGLGVLETGADGLYHVTREYAGDPIFDLSALDVLMGENGFEIYLTQQGNDLPRIVGEGEFLSLLSSSSVVVPWATGESSTLETVVVNLPGVELALMGILIVDWGTTSEEVSVVEPEGAEADQADQEEFEPEVPPEEGPPAEERMPAWERFRLGLDEAFPSLSEEFPGDESGELALPPLPAESPPEAEELPDTAVWLSLQSLDAAFAEFDRQLRQPNESDEAVEQTLPPIGPTTHSAQALAPTSPLSWVQPPVDETKGRWRAWAAAWLLGSILPEVLAGQPQRHKEHKGNTKQEQ